MLIECNNCNATYKIDDNRIPAKKAFIRCSRCGQSIVLPYTPGENHLPESEYNIIFCENCETSYNIPKSKFNKQAIKVRCSKCNHEFYSDKKDNGKQKNIKPLSEKKPSYVKRDFKKDAPPLNIPEMQIPVESDINVEGLFEDMKDVDNNDKSLDERQGSNQTSRQYHTPMSKQGTSPDEEYLEAIKISDENEEEMREISAGSVAAQYKYKFFLDPKAENIKQKRKKKPVVQENKIPEQTPAKAKTENSPASYFSNSIANDQNSILEEENALSYFETDFVDRRKNWIAFTMLFIFVLSIAVGAWFFFYQKSIAENEVGSLILDKATIKNEIRILEPLKGYRLKNIHADKKLFIISGEIQNLFETKDRISWVEIEGRIYGEDLKLIDKNTVYAGNILDQESLHSWKKEKIDAFLGYNNGRNNANTDLDFQQKLPFQIVLDQTTDKTGRIEAKIISYIRSEKKINANQ